MKAGERRPARAPLLTRRQQQLGVLACALWVVAWGLRAVYLDNRVTSTDTFFPQTKGLFFLLQDPMFDAAWIWGWLNAAPTHPPLPALYGALFCWLAGFCYEAVQVSSVVLHALVVVELYRLTRACARDRLAPLTAAALGAAAPALAAWFRVDYPESLTTLLVVMTLRQGLSTDLTRTGAAAKLGLLVGLGALCKLSFWLVILPPAACFLAARVRGRVTLLNALVLFGVASLVCGWWYAGHLPAIGKNMASSTSTDLPLDARLWYYLVQPPGNLALVAASLAGAALVSAGRGVTSRHAAWLLLTAYLPALALLLGLFDPWERYILPLIPVACLLAGLALARALALVPARVAPGLLLAAMAVASAAVNLQRPRESYGVAEASGILQPDQRDHGSLARALTRARRLGRPLLIVANAAPAQAWVNGQWTRLSLVPRGGVEMVGRAAARHRLGRGESVSLIQVDGPAAYPDRTWNLGSVHWTPEATPGRSRRLVGRFADASAFTVRLFVLTPE